MMTAIRPKMARFYHGPPRAEQDAYLPFSELELGARVAGEKGPQVEGRRVRP